MGIYIYTVQVFPDFLGIVLEFHVNETLPYASSSIRGAGEWTGKGKNGPKSRFQGQPENGLSKVVLGESGENRRL